MTEQHCKHEHVHSETDGGQVVEHRHIYQRRGGALVLEQCYVAIRKRTEGLTVSKIAWILLGYTITFPLEHGLYTYVWPFNVVSKWLGLR